MRPQPLICVTDVEASSRWYQCLLGCRGAHGGRQYEQLVKDGWLLLQLHSFEIEHHHGPLGNPAFRPYGNGVLLWFEVEDFDAVMQRAAEMAVEIVLPRHRNPPDGEGGPNHWECWMRDPDGYTVVAGSNNRNSKNFPSGVHWPQHSPDEGRQRGRNGWSPAPSGFIS
jgi:catechol 2,3-dioxygenase-like lactoylglutathione lyase family enzyme